MDIVNVHRCTDFNYKLNALTLFKETVSEEAPEFCDDMQKVSLAALVVRFIISSGKKKMAANLPLCPGRSRVPDHSSSPDTQTVSTTAANRCQQGKKIHLPY